MESYKAKATCLLVFLILGQFLCCLLSTQKLWPFNPILVYVEPVPDVVTCTSLVAFQGDQEKDVADLGWVHERVRGRMVGAVEGGETQAERDRIFSAMVDRFRFQAGSYEGLRIYRYTWSLSRGRMTNKELLVEAAF